MIYFNIVYLLWLGVLKTIEYSYKIIKGIMYTTSNTTVCLKLAKLNLLLYTGGYYEWL
mgnify:FL=1